MVNINNNFFILVCIIILYLFISTYLLQSIICSHIKNVSNINGLYEDLNNCLSEGVSPKSMFNKFIKESKILTSDIIDTSIIPQQSNLLLELQHGNPLNLKSLGHKRKMNPINLMKTEKIRHDHTGEEFRYSTKKSQGLAAVETVKKYVDALLNYNHDNDSDNEDINNERVNYLKELLFSNNIEFKQLYENPTAVHHGGHCTKPIPFDGSRVLNCSELCMNPESRLIDGPFVTGDRLYPKGQTYCWSGPSDALSDKLALSGKHRHKDKILCSEITSILVLKDDGSWSCKPQYPFLFGGRSGMEKKACLYDPYIHEPLADENLGLDPTTNFNKSTELIDSITGIVVKSHTDLKQTAYFSKMANATSSTEFLAMANDKEFYKKNFIGCNCPLPITDIYGNQLLKVDQSSNFLFYGLHSCNTNPCVMTRVADNFVHFDNLTNTCHAVTQAEDQVYHAIHGDDRTPLVGTLTPALGIAPAVSLSFRNDDINNESNYNINPIKLSLGPKETNPDNPNENLAIKITRLASPVVPATNNDSSNKTRNVMFIPIQSITLSGTNPKNTIRIPEIYKTEAGCTPPISIGAFKYSSPIPFNVAPYFIEPIPNILADQSPEKPYEHELLVLEGLRNSRLISGNILGGSEMLFSLLLANNGRGKEGNSLDVPGYKRLDRVRKFYSIISPYRRLSTFEKYKNKLTAQYNGHYSSWDLLFREREIEEYSGIKNIDDTFVIREGLLLRSYRSYAGWALMNSSKLNINTNISKLYNNFNNKNIPIKENSSPLNYAQLMSPTTHSLLPTINSTHDIFSIDRDLLFDHETLSRYFTANENINIKIFNNTSPEYSTSPYAPLSNSGWGLNTFRYIGNFKDNIYSNSDKRLKFDESNWTFEGDLLPISIFKKSLIEWGHKEGDIEYGKWLRNNIDTVKEYQGLLDKTNIVSKPMWLTAVWPRTFWRYSSDYFDVLNKAN
uniref:Wsv035-like protein n=1 Tax=Trachysalambria curvirostris majanivirus TaxID=2984281 RepID=A0A9C7F893_9VIRU|nr:MAG: wsv035-like protein [Trachysalambria curvirostris majanivirus]